MKNYELEESCLCPHDSIYSAYIDQVWLLKITNCKEFKIDFIEGISIDGKPINEVKLPNGGKYKLSKIKKIILRDSDIEAFTLQEDIEISFENVTIKSKLIISPHSNIMTNSCYIFGYCGEIDISDTTFKEDFVLNLEYKKDNIPSKINFEECHFEKKLKIRNKEKNYQHTLENKKYKVKSLNIIDCTLGKEAYLRIGFLVCENFLLSNIRNLKDGEVNIGECEFGKFHINNFRNIGKFKLFNTTPIKKYNNTLFQIDNTSIGNADLQSVDLDGFEKVKMFDNIFTNLQYTDIQWKDDIQVKNEDNEDISLKQKMNTYRILKNVATNNNDQIQALVFYKNEMKNYKKLVLANKDKYSKSDIYTLYFNEYTNDFGLNWIRPIRILFVTSVIFYCMLLVSVGDVMLPRNNWGEYFIFINPIHKTKFIFSEYWSVWSYFIDASFRLIEGLLIYQIIQSFRKYSRLL